MKCLPHPPRLRALGRTGLLLLWISSSALCLATPSPRLEPIPTATPDAAQNPEDDPNPEAADTPMDQDEGLNPAFNAALSAPIASDQYWDALARCETNSRWNRDGKWGGALGIYIKTWKIYGGLEFAPRAGLASRLEQIEVANRIATLGYTSPSGYRFKPVGFRAWGCALRMTPPVLVWHRTHSLLIEALNHELSDDHRTELLAALGAPPSTEWSADWDTHVQALLTRYRSGLGFEDLGLYKPHRRLTPNALSRSHLTVIGQPDPPPEP